MKSGKPARPPQPVILYHHRTQGVDAQGIHVREMCRAFERLGFTVIKISLHADEQVGKASRSGFVSLLAARLPRLAYEMLELGYNLVGVTRLVAAVALHRPRFIYERYCLFNVSGALASKLTGTPLAQEVNSPLAHEKSLHGGLVLKTLAQRMETFIVQSAHTTFAVSGVLKSMLVAQGALGDHITVMPNGVNPDEYRDIPPSGRDAPGGAGGIVIGFTGWFRPWHGLAEMTRALDDHGIFQAGGRLLLVGDGPARPDIERVVRERSLAGHITITGPADRAQLLAHLGRMEIALQPAATAYASPMKLFEYLAAGKAVVAPDQANIREVVRHGEQALLFPPGDFAACAEAVSLLMADRELRQKLGEAGRRSIAANGRTWDANAARVAKLMARS